MAPPALERSIYVAQENEVLNATDEIEAGWWVVKAKYYRLVQRSPRAYQLEEEERLINVNALIRMPKPVQFESTRQSSRLDQQNPLRFLSDKALHDIGSSRGNV